MSQTKGKLHKIQVRQKAEAAEAGNVMTGATTEVFMDGKPLKGVSFLKFEVKAAGIAKVYMEVFAEVDLEVDVQLPRKELKGTGYKKSNGKALAVYEMSNYEPKEVVIQREDMTKDSPSDLANPGCSNAEADKKPYCDSCGCGKKAAYEKKNG